jgi:ZIP family zinc transporter
MIDIIIISLLAGLATALGGIIGISVKKFSSKALGLGLGFSSGVMIVIAFIGLLFKALELGPYLLVVSSFIIGAVIMMLLDILIPHQYMFKETGIESEKKYRLMKLGILVSLGIALHNFPEGAVVGIGYTVLPAFGLVLALAIAIHNIPEGIAVAVPLCAAGVKRRRIFLITLLSGLTEPIGAVDELIPVAKKYGHVHAVNIGIILGMALALVLESII